MRGPVSLRGSGPILAATVVLVVGAFFALRGGSTFLRVEAAAGDLRPLASAHGLDPAAVMALREQAPDLPLPAFALRVAAFARLRGDLGEPLAAVAVAGGEVAARAAVERAGGDPAMAWQAFRHDPRALPGVRYEHLRARFAARAPARGH